MFAITRASAVAAASSTIRRVQWYASDAQGRRYTSVIENRLTQSHGRGFSLPLPLPFHTRSFVLMRACLRRYFSVDAAYPNRFVPLLGGDQQRTRACGVSPPAVEVKGMNTIGNWCCPLAVRVLRERERGRNRFWTRNEA